ncbi:conjugal transfer protein TraN [Escherichia coli]|nr:conjugal transfer protein TraN [Escherichia coli]
MGSRVEWVESCPFNKADGVLTDTECSEPGGTKTGVMEGKPWNITEHAGHTGINMSLSPQITAPCQKYVDNPACTLASRQCAFYSMREPVCMVRHVLLRSKIRKVMVCGETSSVSMAMYDKAQSGQSNDFAEAVSQLAALASR